MSRLTHTLVLGAITAALAFAATASAQADDINFLPAASIDVDAAHQLVGGVARVSAIADYVDIASSPYILVLRDMTSGMDVKWCGFSNVCTAPVAQPIATTHVYRAFIDTFDDATVASSSTLPVTWSSTIVLNAGPSWLFEGQTSTLAATSVSSHPITIKDKQSGATVGPCTQITPGTCSVTVTNAPSIHTYVASQVIGSARNSPVVTSNDESVQWEKIVG